MYVVYVLYSKTFDQIYIGFTKDLIDRFNSHNQLATKGHTIKYRPWMVLHVEFFDSKKEAMSREKQLKSYQGRMFCRSLIQQI